LDVSTAFRFHFGEMLLSVVVRSIQVMASGASPLVATLLSLFFAFFVVKRLEGSSPGS
jgi:hypothetical protein